MYFMQEFRRLIQENDSTKLYLIVSIVIDDELFILEKINERIHKFYRYLNKIEEY